MNTEVQQVTASATAQSMDALTEGVASDGLATESHADRLARLVALADELGAEADELSRGLPFEADAFDQAIEASGGARRDADQVAETLAMEYETYYAECGRFDVRHYVPSDWLEFLSAPLAQRDGARRHLSKHLERREVERARAQRAQFDDLIPAAHLARKPLAPHGVSDGDGSPALARYRRDLDSWDASNETNAYRERWRQWYLHEDPERVVSA